MKLNNITRIIFLVFILAPFFLSAQDQRLVKTKVADALALLPATDNQQSARMFQDIINLGDEGLQLVTDGVQPNGVAEGVPSRYAVSLLTHYATTKDQKVKIEKAYLAALKKATNAEVKSYFMDNLKVVGSNESVAVLREYIGDKESYDPAISTLVRIGSEDASKALMNALSNQPATTQVRLIKALGELNYQPALASITAFASSENALVKKQALWTIALLADASSYQILLQQTKNVGFKNDPTEATTALVEYLHQITSKGNSALVKEISKALVDNTADASQQHFRLAGLKGLAHVDPQGSVATLIKELSRFDAEYQKEILKIAVSSAGLPAALKLWQKEYKKSTGSAQADILSMLAKANRNDGFVETMLLPALSSNNQPTRIAAASEIASYRNKEFTPALLDYLLRATDDAEIAAAKANLLQVADKETDVLITQKLETAQSKNKVALLQILSTRRAVDHFAVIAKQTSSGDAVVKEAAYNALPNVSAASNVSELLKMLSASENDKELKAIQSAIISGLDKNAVALINAAYPAQKVKLLPVLPYLNDNSALEKVTSAFYQGSEKEKQVAFDALKNWQDSGAIRTLLAIRKDGTLKQYHAQALQSFVSQVGKSSWPDDQKLLLLREMMTLASGRNEKSVVIRAAGNVRTFLSLMFVAEYLDDQELSSAASRAAMQIALPTSDAKPGLTGIEVRKTLERMLDKLTGEDSQYERIDILTYLESLPYTKGYESIFNGKDLSGWQGLVENPIARAKMTKEVLAKKQLEANAKVKNNWSVKDGIIVFQGDGANLCTTRPYGDFEMIVDWKISKNGDSGIYLRGSPQVQIWDISRVQDGAQVGSGGLYNNQKERSTPLIVADNPIGEWNTFYIKMVGDRVTVFLNGILVVDNVVMENYWDRNLPIFSEEAIELQAHGTDLAFRNIYVKELSTKSYELSKEEKEQGFDLLFNGKDLNNWVGNKTDYVVEDNTIAIYPTKEGHGNLNTEKEYSDFIFRFEFQLTPGANNGLGIHAPLEGDAAYAGKEIQILDNDAPVYSKLEVYQYHGSVYGVIAAKRGFLKPTGEWNQEEVYVKGDYIKVTLNGTVILEGDMKKASKNGTLDHKEHPGLNRHMGHMGFLGHGSVVKFRNIRIKDLSK
ncbi:MAG: family 16 glycoside hydrolase [Cyclobacteriaceae bacterium]